MSRLGNFGGRLYRGEVSLNFVGRQKLWYTISGVILVVAIAALIFRGLAFSVEFSGGSVFTVPAQPAVTQTSLDQVVTANGGTNPTVTEVKPFNGKQASWQVQTEQLSTTTSLKIEAAIAQKFGMSSDKVSVTTVGSSWGSAVTEKAIQALIAFLIVIIIYLSIAFEWRMAAAAFVALAHDILITVGVYALAGFQVSPATIIGLLTILGYSLYDTVVVFDKVRENTTGLLATRRSTYSDAANLALNQTLVRSINTSLTALLPVAAILVVGSLLLGNGELKDLSLVLFIGMLSGTYSSICIATPVLADLKERDPKFQQLARQVALKAAGGRAARRAKAGVPSTAVISGSADTGAGDGGSTAAGGSAARPRGAATVTATPGGGTDLDVQDTGIDADQPAGLSGDAGTAEEPLDSDAVAAGQPVSSPHAAGRPPGVRQQPVRRSASQRRPSGKKKRR